MPAILSLDRPFTGEHVSVVGKGGVLSRKDLRSVIERLGGSCAFSLTPNTTIVVTTGEPLPGEAERRVVEDEHIVALHDWFGAGILRVDDERPQHPFGHLLHRIDV